MVCEKKKTEQLIHSAVNRMVRKEYFGWPPECGFLIYQPKRPASATPKGKKLMPSLLRDFPLHH